MKRSHHCNQLRKDNAGSSATLIGWIDSLRDHGGVFFLDLRDREGLMHAYGLDDVDEIGGPRASAQVLSHMTARWQDLESQLALAPENTNTDLAPAPQAGQVKRARPATRRVISSGYMMR